MLKTLCNILIELGILALIVVPPVLFGAVLSPHITMIQIIIWGLGWLWVVKSLLKQSIRYISAPLDLPLLLFLIWGGVNLLTSTSQHRTELALSLLGSYAILYGLIVQQLRTVRRVVGLAFLLVLVGCGESIFGLVQYLSGATTVLGHPTPNIGTLNATYFNHNHFAGFLILIMPVALGLLIGSAHFEKRLFLAILFAIMGSALVLSLSRGGLLGFAVAVAGFFLCLSLKHVHDPEFRKRFVLTLLIGGLIVGAAVVWIGVSPIAHRSLLRTVMPDQETLRAEIRFHLWRSALPLLTEFPLFGSGLGTFEDVFRRYRPATLSQNQHAYFAHNDYLELTIEMGLPALFLVCWAIIRFYRYGLRSYFAHRHSVLTALLLGGLGSCTAMLVHSFFDFNLQIPANALLFVIIVAMTTASAHLLWQRHGEFQHTTSRPAVTVGEFLLFGRPRAYRWKTSWKTVVPAVGVLLLLGGGIARQQVALRYYAAANSARVLGHFFNAIDAYQRAIAIDAWNADYYEGLALTYQDLGRKSPDPEKWYRLAIDTFEHVAELRPYQAMPLYRIGQLFDHLNQEADAVQAFQAAVNKEPHLAFYRENLGHYLLYIQQPVAAFAEYRQAIQFDPGRISAILERCQTYHLPYSEYQAIFPDDAALRVKFAEWLARQRLWEESKQEYHKAIELSGGAAEYYDAMQNACRQRRDAACLRDIWRELADQEPDNIELRQQIAESYAGEQQWEQALREYERLFEAFPDNAAIYTRIGQLYQRLERWDDAIQHYKRLLARFPDHAELYQALAGIYSRQNAWQDAIAVYREALDAGVQEAALYAELGNLYGRTDSPEQARAAYEQAVQRGDRRFEIYRRLAELYEQTGQPQNIPVMWSRYIEVNSRQPDALFTLARHYLEQKEWLKAVTLMKEIIALAPTNAEYRIFLANLYAEQNMLHEAIEQWEKVVRAHAQNVNYHLQLAALYEAVEDWGQARTAYRRILQLAPNQQQAQQRLTALGG